MPRFDPATPLVHPLPGPERAEVRPGVVYAEAAGVPVELVEVPDGHHAFDTVDDTDASRDAIRRVLSFLRRHLTA